MDTQPVRLFLAITSLIVASGLSTAKAQSLPYYSAAPTQGQSAIDYLTAVDSLSAASIREALLTAWQHGLNPSVYWSAELEQSFLRGTLETDFDRRQILAVYVKALRDVYSGSVNPTGLASDIKVKRKDFLTAEQVRLVVLSSQGSARLALDKMAPQFPVYQSLKMALQRLYPLMETGLWESITPAKKPLSLGKKDPVIIKLKERLRQLGYRIDSMNDTFDQDMLAAINDIQMNLKMKPDGVISPGGRTWKFFSVSLLDRLSQLQADMEQLRWFPQNLEDRHIFVNTAFSHFMMTDKKNNISMSFKAINGTAERKTPTLRDRITYLVMNPTWTIPPTVFLNDKVEILKKLDSKGIRKYFTDNRFEVYTADFSRTIDPTSIDWKSIKSSSVNFYIRQKPSYNNALGVVKFMMTNPYAIYLHDTNQRDLFGEAQRLRSSGCVRLEKPLDLAEYLLAGTQWSRPQIENFVVKEGQLVDQETRVDLKEPMPVYLVPVTSQMNSDGVIRFVEDVYGHNQLILSQVKGLGR
ncbi:L,D-transpeptidase family protein [Bdellovibrio bacteriovorus]|uniref:L,D-transpeptidase family protein n=1 Tax=Bdellovibrio bacteriovorus TaxID=959 RepID=UPI003A812643